MPKKQQQTLLSYFSKDPAKPKTFETDNFPSQNNPTVLISDEESASEESDTAEFGRASTKKKRRIVVEDEGTNDEEESETPEEPTRNSDNVLSKDSSDIEEDEMSFLKKTDIIQKRTRGKKKSTYLENLKQLKDRKTSFNIVDEDLDGPIDKYFGQSTRDTSESDLELSEDSDFVVEDDVIDGVKMPLLVKDKNEDAGIDMPAEFSKNRVFSWSKQFRIYVESLVAMCLDIEIESTDEYKLAKSAVLRRIESYKDSILTSDIWLSDFKSSVDLYPHWKNVVRKSNYSETVCQACKANKPATMTIGLSSEKENVDVVFHLGRECFRKAELYHKFMHFEARIYNEVEREVKRVLKKHPELEKSDCDGICKELMYNNFIQTLFRNTKKDFLKTVRVYNLKGERYKLEDTSSSDS